MYVYGKNVALQALIDNKKISKAYIQNNFNDNQIINLLKKSNVSIKTLSKIDMDRKVKGLHQGIILDIEEYKYHLIDEIIKDNGLIVILDHIVDPHNFGAIIRTCVACDIEGIIIPTDRSVSVNDTVIKTSAGTADKIKIVKVTNLNNTIKYLKQSGYWIIGTDCCGDDYTTIDYKGKTCIICGSEGEGLSKLVKDNCDFMASIPISKNVESLNASVATAVILFKAKEIRGK